jgi:hypothetical protein
MILCFEIKKEIAASVGVAPELLKYAATERSYNLWACPQIGLLWKYLYKEYNKEAYYENYYD